MKTLALIVSAFMVASFPVALASQLSFSAFDSNGCTGDALDVIAVFQSGANSASFYGPRKSFQILSTDHDCELIVFANKDFTGTKETILTTSEVVGWCAGTIGGLDFNSFDVHCN